MIRSKVNIYRRSAQHAQQSDAAMSAAPDLTAGVTAPSAALKNLSDKQGERDDQKVTFCLVLDTNICLCCCHNLYCKPDLELIKLLVHSTLFLEYESSEEALLTVHHRQFLLSKCPHEYEQ